MALQQMKGISKHEVFKNYYCGSFFFCLESPRLIHNSALRKLIPWQPLQFPHLIWRVLLLVQEGYGIFSYSHSHLDKIFRYILDQEIHHAKFTFKREYLELLKKFDISFDEKYVFDFY